MKMLDEDSRPRSGAVGGSHRMLASSPLRRFATVFFSGMLLLLGAHGFVANSMAPRARSVRPGRDEVGPMPLPASRRLSKGGGGGVLRMVPRYDPAAGRWEPTGPDEGASAGYSPLGSLVRQGPVPFFQRLADPESYDQGVMKMMANDRSMDRNEAQGNMDAYLANPNDWALQKMEEKRGAPKYDYANANVDGAQLALTGTWAGILLLIAARVVYDGAVVCDDICQEYGF